VVDPHLHATESDARQAVYAQLLKFVSLLQSGAGGLRSRSCGSSITAWLISIYKNRLIF